MWSLEQHPQAPNGVPTCSIFDPWTASDYTTPGAHALLCGAAACTLTVVQAVTIPEPSTAGLILIGIGSVWVMRKRMAQGLTPAN